MYFIVDTISELDYVARLNGVCIGLASAKHALGDFYASGRSWLTIWNGKFIAGLRAFFDGRSL
jgi:hypothetical protein